MNKHSELLNRLEKCLSNLKQTTLAGPNYKEVNELCVEWLKANGYSVKPPQQYPDKIKRLDDLISLFYLLFQKHYPNFSVPYNTLSQDRRLAKLFINSRMEASGLSKEKAMEECAAIIETFFKYKDRLNFESAPNFGVFGQQNMAWVTNRILEFMNAELKEIEEKKNEKLIAEHTARLEASGVQFGWTKNQLDEMYERIGGKNG